MTLIVELADPRAKMPTYGSDKAAGLDLYSVETRTLRPGQRALIPTGIKIQLPEGTEGQIRPRSGLAKKHGVTVLNAPGTIDEDYRGVVGVMLVNLGHENFLVEEGKRIAQLVVAPCVRVTPVEGGVGDTERGEGGFGSTGE